MQMLLLLIRKSIREKLSSLNAQKRTKNICFSQTTSSKMLLQKNIAIIVTFYTILKITMSCYYINSLKVRHYCNCVLKKVKETKSELKMCLAIVIAVVTQTLHC